MDATCITVGLSVWLLATRVIVLSSGISAEVRTEARASKMFAKSVKKNAAAAAAAATALASQARSHSLLTFCSCSKLNFAQQN